MQSSHNGPRFWKVFPGREVWRDHNEDPFNIRECRLKRTGIAIICYRDFCTSIRPSFRLFGITHDCAHRLSLLEESLGDGTANATCNAHDCEHALSLR
jgi:hypothetical protein